MIFEKVTKLKGREVCEENHFNFNTNLTHIYKLLTQLFSYSCIIVLVVDDVL